MMIIFLFISFFFTLIYECSCSTGDLDDRFINCINTNSLICQEDPYHNINWILYFMQWNCEDNIKYECMRINTHLRLATSEDVVQYYGKWSFVRVFGFQEILSSLFSLFNFIPHYINFFDYKNTFPPKSFEYRNMWLAYSILSMNTWFWSFVFHARDTYYTEKMDYFGTSAVIMLSIGIIIIRLFSIKNKKKKIMILFICFSILFYHIYTMLISFDYGYNMKISLMFGIIHTVMWGIWGIIEYKRRKYVWKVLLVNLLMWIFALFEIFDFPPLFDLLDAHAVWHGSTPILGFLFYSFLFDDAEFEIKITHQN